MVFDIQKFSVNDGPGIRTTVFFKGCPLNCLWCHNPESREQEAELLYTAEKCACCGECVSRCPRGCQNIQEGLHTLDRRYCIKCGQCVKAACPALKIAGRKMSSREVIDEALKDRLFYEHSGGGITLSGGEPLYQPEFALELLQTARAEGLHTCLETAGFAPPEQFKVLLPWVDLFLFDYKETDPVLHQEYTGVSNELILQNLHAIDRQGGKIILRCPLIPTKNDREDHFQGIAETAGSLRNIQEIQVEPYHPFGEGKCAALGKACPIMGLGFPDEALVARWVQAIQEKTPVTVKRA